MPIRDIRSKRSRIQELNQIIPGMEERLGQFIMERAGLENAVMKVEAHELGKKHDGLCEAVSICSNCDGIDPASCAMSCVDGKEKCQRYYGHTGAHSFHGGGYG